MAAYGLAVLLVGCGVPGAPLPPLLELPQPVQDLRARQVGAAVALTFTRPLLTTEGTRIRSLDRLEVHGSFAASANGDADPLTAGALLAALPAADLPDGPGVITYDLPLDSSLLGTTAAFALKAVNDRGEDAGFSNVARLSIMDLPEPPVELTAELTESAVILRWTPSPRSAFGGEAPEPNGYEVLRVERGSGAEAQSLGVAVAPPYEDQSLQFGRNYLYQVRAFRAEGDSRGVSELSGAVAVAAQDRFPPAQPRNLRAIAVPGAVELAWSPNEEPDLAGYRVYRSAEGAQFVGLNDEPREVPLYRDSSVSLGTRYRYVVRAVDTAGNESPPSEEAAVVAE